MRLLKVMIVDDEILAIKDLENLISWEKHGFQIIASATNSVKALELYQTFQPQINFIDIRMPIMDGLQLSKQIFSLGRPVKIILLTAYRDFDYAKKAVELGVSDYLLKHDINEDSILTVLNKIRLELEEELENRRIIRQKYFRNMLEDRDVETTIKEILVYETPDSDYSLALAVPNQPFLEHLRNSDRPSVSQQPLYSIDFPDYVSDYDILNTDGSLIFVFILRRTNSHLESRERALALGGKILSQLEKLSPETFSIILTNGCGDKTGLLSLYRKALLTLPYLVFYDREAILYTDDIVMTTPEPPPISIDNTLVLISNALLELNSERVTEQIQYLFQIVSEPVWNPDGLKKACNQLLYLLGHFQNQNSLDSVFEKNTNANGTLSSPYTLSELRVWFLQKFSEAVRQVNNLRQSVLSKKTKQAIEYIHGHYAEDLTVDKVAEKLGFSGVYLSQIFKKDTGKTFLEYLTDYRIEIAKDLLQKGNYKVYEVAEIVGYKTSQYFSQVFHKITGTYPIDYRERGAKP
ncbi:MAG TPA: hypothetical protein DDW65_04840 [Firmicutes bacterium]|jgi:two-component system, response regulator YesN|nr:hypothetical protein [Bacillota bacterium]